MADFYARQQTGTADGNKAFVDRVDGRQVGAREHRVIANKPTNQAFAAGDMMYCFRRRAGETIRRITVNAGAGFASAVSIGTKSTPSKYAAGVAVATLDTPFVIGPIASQAALDPDTADEYIWATFAAAVGAAIPVTVEFELAGLN